MSNCWPSVAADRSSAAIDASRLSLARSTWKPCRMTGSAGTGLRSPWRISAWVRAGRLSNRRRTWSEHHQAEADRGTDNDDARPAADDLHDFRYHGGGHDHAEEDHDGAVDGAEHGRVPCRVSMSTLSDISQMSDIL